VTPRTVSVVLDEGVARRFVDHFGRVTPGAALVPVVDAFRAVLPPPAPDEPDAAYVVLCADGRVPHVYYRTVASWCRDGVAVCDWGHVVNVAADEGRVIRLPGEVVS
jgi:hypothetical protein